MTTRSLLLAGLTSLALIPAAFAQTPLGGDTNQPLQPPPSANDIPVSQVRVDQANRQIEGEFDHMSRPESSDLWVGGQIQEAWSDSISTEGVFVYEQCDGCLYKVRTRVQMVSSIVLPRSIKIHAFDVGDATNFQIKKRADNILTILPRLFGIDTNVNIYAKDGSVWSFYLRAEDTNSLNIPDLKVIIKGNPELEDKPVLSVKTPTTTNEVPTPAEPSDPTMDLALGELATSALDDKATEQIEDFVRSAPVDPDKFHGWADYEIWGSDETLKPKAVFRDDHFTYIQYGDKWDKIELPTAYVVVDEIDEVINTRVQGRTYIVESTRDLITLKSGQSYLCIRYTGDDA